MTSTSSNTDMPVLRPPACVFGASGEQGRAVTEGLIDRGYHPVYAFTRQSHDTYLTDGLGAVLVTGDLASTATVEECLRTTRAQAIFLVTTTDMPSEEVQESVVTSVVLTKQNGGERGGGGDNEQQQQQHVTTDTSTTSSTAANDNAANTAAALLADAAEAEYQVICEFFQCVLRVYKQDGLSRHVVFSSRDDVQKAVLDHYEQQQAESDDKKYLIEPLYLPSTTSSASTKNKNAQDMMTIVPHYSAKGRGAAYALQLFQTVPDLKLTILTMPFLYSNFLGFFAPLPVLQDDEDDNNTSNNNDTAGAGGVTQWTLSACFGDFQEEEDEQATTTTSAETDGSTENVVVATVASPTTAVSIHTKKTKKPRKKIDMMGVTDLSVIVPNIFDNPDKYNGQNLRLVGEQLTMDEIAEAFSDLFGKDVIYNPLTVQEVAALPFPTAPAMAQMCQFLGNPGPLGLEHDVDATLAVCWPKKPQRFEDWLITHSDSSAFSAVGLDVDAPDILSVTVFGATSREGMSVLRGLLADPRKQYRIRATTRHLQDADKIQAILQLEKQMQQQQQNAATTTAENNNDGNAVAESRIEIVYADFDNVESCEKAVEGMDGAFLVTDFYDAAGQDMDVEERHAKNVIDACERSKTVKHLVFATMESVEEMNRLCHLGLNKVHDIRGKEGTVLQFDAKARAAAYARTKKLSVTYVLMPCYSEIFFDMIERQAGANGERDRLIFKFPDSMLVKDTTTTTTTTTTSGTEGGSNDGAGASENAKLMCMSVDELGPAVANIFDSYQVYAGHEIGLVTDFVTVKEVKDIIERVFLKDGSAGGDDDKNNKNPVELETEPVAPEEWGVKAKDTYMKDLGQMFAYMAHTDAVKMRRSIAKTLKLIPSARPLKEWVEQNKENEAFREKLGLR